MSRRIIVTSTIAVALLLMGLLSIGEDGVKRAPVIAAGSSMDPHGNGLWRGPLIDPDGWVLGRGFSIDPNGDPFAEGPIIDPNGGVRASRGTIDPDGQTIAEGSRIDPLGGI